MRPSETILITGASGFVGANLCHDFARQGFKVIAGVGPSKNPWRLQGLDSVARVFIDMESDQEIRAALKELKPTAIFNCAAYGAYPSQTERDRIYQVNFSAVRSMLETVKEIPGFRAFIQAGSSSEYGLNCKAPAETEAPLPDSDYAVSKVAATALVQYHGAKHGVPAWVFRLYSVYGPFEESSRLIPRLLTCAREGRLPPLVNPRISRDFIHVDDVARAFGRVLERAHELPKGAVYNIGRGECVTLEKLVSVARATFAITEEPAWGSMPERHWDHPDWYANPARARAELGWSAGLSLEEGLKSTMKWIEENPAMVEASARNTIAPSKAASPKAIS